MSLDYADPSRHLRHYNYYRSDNTSSAVARRDVLISGDRITASEKHASLEFLAESVVVMATMRRHRRNKYRIAVIGLLLALLGAWLALSIHILAGDQVSIWFGTALMGLVVAILVWARVSYGRQMG